MIVKETIFLGLIFVIWTMILCIVITEGNKQSMPIKVALALYGIFFIVWCGFIIASALWLIAG